MAKKGATQSRKQSKPSEDNYVFSDGMLSFKIEGGEHGGETVSVDLLWLRLKCEELEESHKLKVNEEKQEYIPTAEFLSALSRSIEQETGYCTPSLAFQIWVAGSRLYEEIQKKIF